MCRPPFETLADYQLERPTRCSPPDRAVRSAWRGAAADPPQRPDQPDVPDGVRELRPPRRARGTAAGRARRSRRRGGTAAAERARRRAVAAAAERPRDQVRRVDPVRRAADDARPAGDGGRWLSVAASECCSLERRGSPQRCAGAQLGAPAKRGALHRCSFRVVVVCLSPPLKGATAVRRARLRGCVLVRAAKDPSPRALHGRAQPDERLGQAGWIGSSRGVGEGSGRGGAAGRRVTGAREAAGDRTRPPRVARGRPSRLAVSFASGSPGGRGVGLWRGEREVDSVGEDRELGDDRGRREASCSSCSWATMMPSTRCCSRAMWARSPSPCTGLPDQRPGRTARPRLRLG